MSRIAVILASSVMVAGCQSGQYTPPIAQDYSNTVVVNKPFDAVWGDLVSYASGSFFGIKNFEKESGLLTLSFGAGDASRYIDCGNFSVEQGANSFNGTYVQWVQQTSDAELNGAMNLLVRPLDRNNTEVVVNARYIFTIPSVVIGSGIYAQRIPTMTWSFDSRTQDTRAVYNAVPGTSATRTCQPTGVAEQEILTGVQK